LSNFVIASKKQIFNYKFSIFKLKLLILSKFHYYLLLTLFFCCSKPKSDPPPPRANCGEIVRLYSQNTTFEEGNPCGNNDDYSWEEFFEDKDYMFESYKQLNNN
jgi:hypothetical protein